MNWNCPSCTKPNSIDDAKVEAETERFCTHCGRKIVVAPDGRVWLWSPDAHTGKMRAYRPTSRTGIGRPILVLLKGQRVGAELPLPTGPVKIGSDGADWDFPNQGLSPIHFEIETMGETSFIRDRSGSAEPGVQVNARPVREAELHNGDQIHAGLATFLFLRIFRTEEKPHGGDEIWNVPSEADETTPIASTVIVPKPKVGTAAPGQAMLEMQREAGTQQYPLLLASSVIGRGSGEISLDDPLVSQRHAEIGRLPDGAYFVKDLASANGTFLNGQRVEYSPIHSGDEIRVGNLTLTFRQSI